MPAGSLPRGRRPFPSFFWVVAGLALGVLALHRPLLTFEAGPLGLDYGRIYLPPMIEQAEALRDGRILLWERGACGGTPLWARPNTAAFYPPLSLALFCFGALGGLNLTLLAHVLLGAVGCAALARRLGASPAGALLAGLAWIGGRPVVQLLYHLPQEVLALAWLPWALAALAGLSRRGSLAACAAGAAFAGAGVVWSGGYTTLLYFAIACGAFALCDARDARGLARAAIALAAAGAGSAALAAGRLLPAMDWVGSTDRAERLPFEVASTPSLPLALVPGELGVASLLPLGLAIVALLAPGSPLRRPIAAFLAIGALAIVLALPETQPFLYERVPGFSRVRGPRRALLLLQIAFPMLIGLGWTGAAGLLARARLGSLASGWRAAAWTAIPAALLLAHGRARVGLETRALTRLEDRVAANRVHRELARRAAEEDRFRVLGWYPDRRRGRDVDVRFTAAPVATALGLELVDGVIGRISVDLLHRDCLDATTSRARAWGLLNARYVTSPVPLDEPGLVEVACFERDPKESVPGASGPLLYRNEHALPRAFLVRRAVLLVEPSAAQWSDALQRAAWDPRRVALARATCDELAAMAPDERAAYDAIVPCGDPAAVARAEELVRAAGGRAGGIGAALDGAPAVAALPDYRTGHDAARATLPAHAGDAWLVLAETYALHAGWRAEVGGAPAPLRVANGAATLVRVPAGARSVELSYRPPGLVAGLAASCAAALALTWVAWLGTRRSRRAAA